VSELLVAGLWLICLALAPTMLLTMGPLAGLIATVVASGIWIVVGPRPLPGLIPGLMAMAVIMSNAGCAIHCVRLLLAHL
jgi:hypothetical protein